MNGAKLSRLFSFARWGHCVAYAPRLILPLAAALLALTAVLSLLNGAAVQASNHIIYVNANVIGGGDNGGSWADAFADLQDALAVADNGDEIWVAAGIYTPGAIVSDSFSVASGIALYGGFNGGETERDQRDWTTNLTILSGDIDGDDITDANGVVTDTANIVGANSYHVVRLDGTAVPILNDTVVDGFIITAGQANGPMFYLTRGGGLYCDGNGAGGVCSPTLSNLVFSGNWAQDSGGGLYLVSWNGGQSNPALNNVVFTGNSAGSWGGGMFSDGRNNGHASPLLQDVSFSHNTATSGGGGMYNVAHNGGVSNPVLTNVLFDGNQANSGGGMYNDTSDGVSQPILTNVVFSGNAAVAGSGDGGGIFNRSSNSGAINAALTNVVFINNTTGAVSARGGGISNESVSDGAIGLSLTDVSFTNNTAVQGGGLNSHSHGGGVFNLALDNVTFSDNQATLQGGGMRIQGDLSQATLANVLFNGNTAGSTGGGLYAFANTSMNNVVFSDNSGTDGGGFLNLSIATLTHVTFTNNSATSGGGIYNNGTITLTHALFSDNVASLGGGGFFNFALENVESVATMTSVIFTDNRVSAASGVGGGVYNFAQSGIARLTVQDGVFIGNQTAGGVLGRGGGVLNRARFATGQTPVVLTNVAFISNTTPGGGGGFYNWVTDAGVADVLITDAQFSHNSAGVDGGGVYNETNTGGSTQLTLINALFNQNAAQFGAGLANRIANDNSANVVDLIDGRFLDNTASKSGGAIFDRAHNDAVGQLNLHSATLVNNWATERGGAIGDDNFNGGRTNLTLNRVIARNNGAGEQGGGLNIGGNVTMINSLLANNTAATGGAALHLNSNGQAELVHVTIGAPVQIGGTAVYVQHSGGVLTMTNSIVANHVVGIERTAGTVNEDYNLFHDNGTDRINVTAGTDSFNGNPRFVFPPRGDYRLGLRSAAVNRGMDAGITADFEGHPRPLGGGFDVGYDEQVRRLIIGSGLYDFLDAGAQINVKQVGNLDSVSVVQVDDEHPNAAGPIGLERYWQIAGLTADGDDASGFNLDLTLPRNGATDPYICRYDSEQWDCARDEFDGDTVTRKGVSAFSDWAVVDGFKPVETTHYLHLPLVVRP